LADRFQHCRRCGKHLEMPGSPRSKGDFSRGAQNGGERRPRHFQSPESAVCADCRIHPPPYTCGIAVGPYDGLYRQAVQRLKFSGKRLLAAPMGAMMAEVIRADERYQAAQIIVPVPASRTGSRSRGYNQAYLLAAAIGAAVKLPVSRKILRQVKYGMPQHELAKEDREVNRIDAFRANIPASLQGRTFLLVDDVMTTGATCRECAKALLSSGAGEVLVVAWAAGIGF
jgi:ComF family protein